MLLRGHHPDTWVDAIRFGKMMDSVMMFAIFPNLIMTVGIVVWRLLRAPPFAQIASVTKIAILH